MICVFSSALDIALGGHVSIAAPPAHMLSVFRPLRYVTYWSALAPVRLGSLQPMNTQCIF